MTAPIFTDQITTAIARLRRLTQVSLQGQWHFCLEDLSVAEVMQAEQWDHWPIAPLNEKEHIAWPRGKQVLWLRQRLVIPEQLHGYPVTGLSLRLALTWWAESAEIFVNGACVQTGDLFDCVTRIGLSPAAQPGKAITLALRLVSPGHDEGALVQSKLIFEATGDGVDPGFVADELTVVQHYLAHFSPEQLSTLAAAIARLDWSALPNRVQFDRSLDHLRQQLPWREDLKQRRIDLLGHAHLDLAWLWPVEETWQAAERTFQSVLQLQQEFPELIFCHSTPALYAWIEAQRPDLFAAIQEQVAAGRWEIAAGLWVEPELNLASGEAIARQVLYGQRYVQEKFGQLSCIAWLPDSFGFCWQLPQILKQGGIDYFVTQKLRWNDTTSFPHEVFWWRSPDGTQIFSVTLPPIGTQINPVQMAAYACEWEEKTGKQESLWLPGVGDHGGGPTRDMLETARRWQQSPHFPRLAFKKAETFLRDLEQHVQGADNADGLPVWNDELYLEFHRGCYTSHADQKWWNRRCEDWLYQAELLASLSTLLTGATYPQQELETAWKQVLFNQFHDILPGSSIPEVFVTANQAWKAVQQTCAQILEQALEAITAPIDRSVPPHPNAKPLLVFNPLNWQRSEVVMVVLPTVAPPGQIWQVYDSTGQPVRSQLAPIQGPEENKAASSLHFLAQALPSIGYRVYWLCLVSTAEQPDAVDVLTSYPAEFVLENECLRVTVDPNTGNLSSVFDKGQQREILSGPGNQLQAFHDQGQYWDAWNIAPGYGEQPLPLAQLTGIHWLEHGELLSRLRVTRQLGQSEFCQDYTLEAETAVLKIATTVDWQERHVLVKAAFSLAWEADWATYEIPCGAIQRPTAPQTSSERAKWEVPALRWADLSTADSGVSLLNDCKYGYDSAPNQLRLTLLRGSTWPDPGADLGYHRFTYALHPHPGNWQTAQTVRRGYELNLPLLVRFLSDPGKSGQPQRPPAAQLLHLGADNLVLTALKQSEESPQAWILRCYESCGHEAELRLQGDLGRAIAHPVDLLEQPLQQDDDPGTSQTLPIRPWQIASFAIAPKQDSQ